MPTPVPRAHVRAMLADHRQRLLRAQATGNLLAVSNDITDELNDAVTFLISNYGEAEAWRFKCLYAECQREADFAQVFTQPSPRVVMQSQLAGPKKGGTGAAIGVLVALFAVGLLIGLSR